MQSPGVHAVKAFPGWSIRTHLILLVAFAVTPALAIILYTGLEQKQNSLGEAHGQCSALVRALAGDMTNTVSSTRQLLTTLAVLPQVRSLDARACNGLFRKILHSDARYLNLQLFRPTGESVASVAPPPPGLNVSDRKYFRDAVHRRAFSAGEFIVGRTVNRPTFNFALPVMGDRGKLLGVVQAAINLERVNGIFDKSHFPAGSALVLLDGTGTVLFHTADARHLIGTKDDQGIFNDMIAAQGSEKITMRFSGGSYRIMAYRSLQLAGDTTPYLYIRLEVPQEAILSKANRILTRNLWLLALAVGLAAVAVFTYANFVILNRTRRLVRSSRLLAEGARDVQVGIPYSEGEFGLIAQAFDDMARTLALREEERATFVRELQTATGKLAESNRQLQHFAYIASHDLQEPLRTITSFIQLLARRYQGKLDKDADEFIAFITDGAKRMQRLINDLLEYSRVESQGSPFVAFEAEGALRAALMNLKKRIEESGAEITHDPLPTITGDESQIIRLFQNLLSNAIKFRGDRSPSIHIACAQTPLECEFHITDNGIGIEGQFFERIFEIFQRLHARNAYPGTGIGLAICRRIVKRHGGSIGVLSEPGKGSSFTFTIKHPPSARVDAA